jgi:hypothetical protein
MEQDTSNALTVSSFGEASASSPSEHYWWVSSVKWDEEEMYDVREWDVDEADGRRLWRNDGGAWSDND